MLSLSAHAHTAHDEVLAKKSITIAIPTDFPPFGFVGTGLKPQGLHTEMANHIGARLGATVDLVPVTSANRIPYLQAKKVHLVISTLGKNPDREKVIDFTAAYSSFFQAVFAGKSLNFKSFADLAGKTVAVTRGAIEDLEITKLAPSAADIKRLEDNNATVSAFVSGQVQAIATGASVAGNMMQRNPQLNAEFKLLIKDSPNFIGVAKGEDRLRLRVNEITSALDPGLVGEVLKVVASLAQDGMTLLMVTHEMAFARKVAHRVVFMHAGRIHEIGLAAQLFDALRTEELRQFLSALA